MERSEEVPHRLIDGDIVTTAGAAGAIMSPWWLPVLHELSEFAAVVAPILGVIWLLIQIAVKLYEAYKRHKFRKELSAQLKGIE